MITVFPFIVVNGFDLLAALQNNWRAYWYSARTRVATAALLWSFGPQWRAFVVHELFTLAMLLGSMWFA